MTAAVQDPPLLECPDPIAPPCPVGSPAEVAAAMATRPRGAVVVGGPPAGAQHHRERLVLRARPVLGPPRASRLEWDKQRSTYVPRGGEHESHRAAVPLAWQAMAEGRAVHRYRYAGRWWVEIRDGRGALLLDLTPDSVDNQADADRVARRAWLWLREQGAKQPHRWEVVRVSTR